MTEANDIHAIDDELNTTAPQDKPQIWKMPDPVFRKTSGKLPKGFEKSIDFPEAEPDPDPAIVQSQAYATPEPQPSNPTLKIVLVVLGLIAMIAFIVVFLTVLYFFFWR